ncbi:MAG: SPFH domain-containing protein [Atopobiaceae bacterium]|jgi:regulator of protease activity HflC (stomatin/prohibitin superfamily)|nr:SPFH domain-containing protein [Atopobiaceae bacterium]
MGSNAQGRPPAPGGGRPHGGGGNGWKVVIAVLVLGFLFQSCSALLFAGYPAASRTPSIGGNMIVLIVILAIAAIVVFNTMYIVRQQHVAVIERLGRFHSISRPGFHVRVPFFDKIAHDVDLMTEDEHMTFDAKTADNVTIELDVSAQYRVDATYPAGQDMGGIYKSQYTLASPVAQMKDYLADALRSQIPNRTLDEVFSEKDAIAHSIDEVVAAKMLGYGYILVTTLITTIRLPQEVQESMNRIVASKNNLASAQNDANAQKVKVVTAAQAKAEAMAAEGKGIADQRANIADGIARSLGTIEASGVSTEEANRLFQFTQWCDMMSAYAATGASTVVLPSDFRENASMFEQMLSAGATRTSGKAPRA